MKTSFDRLEVLRSFRRKAISEQPEPWHDGSRSFEVRRFAGPVRYCDQVDRIRVAHLTDQHVGRVTPMAVQMEGVRVVNQGAPDVVLITGDFVCHSQVYLEELRSVIEAIEAPVFCVLGNHDYWAGAREVRETLKLAGAEVLSNENTVVQLGREQLQIVGLDDAYTGHADRRKALQGLKPGVATIGLSHIGEEAEGLWASDVPLVLAGHTHAGQITIARLHELSIGRLAGHKYVHGLYGSRNAEGAAGSVYVGAGVGAAVMPLRVGARAQREVAFFELGAMPGDFDEHHTSQFPSTLGRAPSERTTRKRADAVVRKEQRRDSRRVK